jgi:hypothetical protein
MEGRMSEIIELDENEPYENLPKEFEWYEVTTWDDFERSKRVWMKGAKKEVQNELQP